MKKVLCHGVFDVLHAGHLAYFKSAKAFGDYLIVSITADKFVNKGPGRPYFTATLRAEMVKALGIVDEVIISESPTAVAVIEAVKPDFYVKGPDYKDLSKDVTGEIHNEKQAVEKHGGKLVFTQDETFSSSTIINRFFQTWADDQRETIEKIRELGGMGAINSALEEIAKLKALIVGEPILDIYRFVATNGISSKSPSISTRFLREETYEGGAIAIRNHLSTFVQSAHLQSYQSVVKKIRYLCDNQKIFEVVEDQPINYWEVHNSEFLVDQINERKKEADLLIIADFGHGMIEGEVFASLQDDHLPFTALMAQTNSSNFGYNLCTKYMNYDYLCMDLREARLAQHDRNSDPFIIARKIANRVYRSKVAITLGENGAGMMTTKWDGDAEMEWDETVKCPAFADRVVDAIGAGDAFFAITSCLMKIGADPLLTLFIGNVFAGLKTKIIGNKSAVSKAALLKACEGILK